MKKILKFPMIGLILFLVACKADQPITSTTSSPLFTKENTRQMPIGLHSGTHSERMGLLRELKLNHIPISHPENVYPNWSDYLDLVHEKQDAISAYTRQFCAQQFLEAYLDENARPTQVFISSVKAELTRLVQSKFKGYQLLYSKLLWLQNHDEQQYVQHTKDAIGLYAKPTLKAPDIKHPDDPRIQHNDALKNQISKMIHTLEQNDSYISKIRAL